ncbi:MAG: hypothetical protein DCC75_12830, partial [Proteobacteria bacterium]
QPTGKNVILVMLDTLRADHVGFFGYERDTTPALDRFASENLAFVNAITSAPWTPPAVGSMFTGLYASSHGMMPPNGRELARKSSSSLGDANLTLAEILKEQGYQTAAVSPNPWIKSEFGYAQGFDNFYYRDRARADEINRAAFKVLDSFSKESPFLLYLHYLDPHDPYNPPGEYSTKFKGSLNARTYTPEIMADINLYDGEIRFMDDMLGRLFEELRSRKLWDESIILIIADHGEQFKERGFQGHGFHLYNEEVHVPLFLKADGRRGKVSYLASPIDVLPTILDLLDVQPPQKLQGISLVDDSELKAREETLCEIDRKFNWKAINTNDGLRMIFDFGPPSEADSPLVPLTVGVFNSLKDYRMLEPLSDEGLAEQLRHKFASLYDSVAQHQVESKPVEIKSDTLEQLESLGYMK